MLMSAQLASAQEQPRFPAPGSAPAPAPRSAPAPGSAPASAPRGVAIGVRGFQRPIVFQPDRPTATLERYGVAIVDGAWTEGWLPVCTGRCVATMPPASRYRVSGSGVRTSGELTLLPGVTPLRLEASTGAAWTLPLGVVATAVGGAGLTGGLVAYGMAGLCALNDQDAHACDSLDATRLAAGIVMGIGVAALVTGIELLTTERTNVNAIQISNGMPQDAAVPAVQIGTARLTPRGIEF